jgi:hypothetical protein
MLQTRLPGYHWQLSVQFELLASQPCFHPTPLLASAALPLTAFPQVVSIYHRRIEHGYPTPSLGRDAVLDQALPWLQAAGVWSRGRFGSYKARCFARGVRCLSVRPYLRVLACACSTQSRSPLVALEELKRGA